MASATLSPFATCLSACSPQPPASIKRLSGHAPKKAADPAPAPKRVSDWMKVWPASGTFAAYGPCLTYRAIPETALSAAGLDIRPLAHKWNIPARSLQSSQYVKVCSLYGAGFYYMPGTDMCIKIGGWVRMRAVAGDNNNSTTWGPFDGNANTRATNHFSFNARGYITADAREQTAYGVARGYIAVGMSADDTGLRVLAASFKPIARSCSGPASRPVCSVVLRLLQPGGRAIPWRLLPATKTPVTPAGWSGATRHSSGAASRPLCRPKRAA